MSFVRERKTSRQIVLRFGNFPTKLNRPLGSASHQSHVIVRERNALSFCNAIKRQQEGRSKTHACYHGSLSNDLLRTFAVVLGSTTYHQIDALPLCSSARWWTFPIETCRCCFYIANSLHIGASSCKAKGH